jgi:ATP-dependent helicase/nuclease subunit B
MSVSGPENPAIIAVSSQLARWLLYSRNQSIADTGTKAWESPNIGTLESWLKAFWDSSWPSKYVISKTQSLKLWETIVEKDLRLSNTNLLQLEKLAQSASKAYENIKLYAIPTTPNSYASSLESETFLRWFKSYEEELENLEAIDPSELCGRIYGGMESGQIALPPQSLIFSGFFEFNPALKRLIQFLSEKGVPINKSGSFENSIPPSSLSKVFESKSIREECQLCAKYIKKSYQPGTTFGIILCDYSKYKDYLAKELTKELSPRYTFPWLDEETPFNFENASPLTREPAIQQALSILSSQQNISLEVFTEFLHSPFYTGFTKEQEFRRKIDREFHREKRLKINLGRSDAFPSTLPGLKKNLKNWFQFVRDKEPRPPSVWARVFSQTLRRLGWPNGDRATNLRTTLIYEAWTECLDALASLDHILGRQTKQQAYTALKRFAEGKSFQPQRKNKPIQIIDFNNTAGMQFDHVWILGTNAESLPATPSPNPFIPINTQKELNLPHSSPGWELNLTQNLLSQFQSQSKTINFSYPLWDKDIATRKSPLINQYSDNIKKSSFLKTEKLDAHPKEGSLLEAFEENIEIPVLTEEIFAKRKDWSRSGYRLIKNQSNCPFRAFAAHRLDLEPIFVPETDFEESERGILVHNALESVWNELKDSSKLRDLIENNQLQDLIKNKIDEVSEKISGSIKNQVKFIELEKKRVVSLIEKWLIKESLRENFEIFGLEHFETINLVGLDLNVRVDRIDRLSDGSQLIIDYKTGAINTADWFQERIQEPQLPLYAIKLKPAGVAYARVIKDPKTTNFSYLSKEPSIPRLPNAPTSFEKKTGIAEWEHLLNYWEACLSSLAKNFLDGKTEIDPFRPGITCKNCRYQSLCRIAETNLDAFLEDEGEGEGEEKL